MTGKEQTYIRRSLIWNMLTVLIVCSVPHFYVQPVNNDISTGGSIETCRINKCNVEMICSSSEESPSVRKTDGNEEFFSNVRRNGIRMLVSLLYIFLFAQMFFVSVYVCQLFFKSDRTHRFSIILFLHRSDGKKSPLQPAL